MAPRRLLLPLVLVLVPAAASASRALDGRAAGALYGLAIGDALAMPVHWYYDVAAIHADFPPAGVTKAGFDAPHDRHPGAFMHLSNTGGSGRGSTQGDVVGRVINHGRRHLWRRGAHYHVGMRAGENTLNALCARLLVRTLAENGVSYSADDWLDAYVSFMTTPGSHNDTYAESYHRRFFANYDKGVEPRDCARGPRDSNIVTIGALVSTPVVVLAAAHKSEDDAAHDATTHAHTTHRDPEGACCALPGGPEAARPA